MGLNIERQSGCFLIRKREERNEGNLLVYVLLLERTTEATTPLMLQETGIAIRRGRSQ